MFYFRILNLPTNLNSSLSLIFNYAVVRSKDLSRETFDLVNTEVLHELKQLESNDGMQLDIEDYPGFKIRGTIVSFCADTKGAHQIFGFLSPSANLFCRLC